MVVCNINGLFVMINQRLMKFNIHYKKMIELQIVSKVKERVLLRLGIDK